MNEPEMSVNATVSEICKAYGHAPPAGRSEIYEILNNIHRDASRDAATLDEAIGLLKRGTKTLTDLASLSNVNTETRRLLVTVAEAFAQFTLKHERAVKK